MHRRLHAHSHSHTQTQKQGGRENLIWSTILRWKPFIWSATLGWKPLQKDTQIHDVRNQFEQERSCHLNEHQSSKGLMQENQNIVKKPCYICKYRRNEPD